MPYLYIWTRGGHGLSTLRLTEAPTNRALKGHSYVSVRDQLVRIDGSGIQRGKIRILPRYG